MQKIAKKHGMPMYLSNLGIAPSEDNVVKYYKKLKSSGAVVESGEGAHTKLKDSLEYLRG